jgi:hypothetical protein
MRILSAFKITGAGNAMKKILIVILAVAVMSGCSSAPAPQTQTQSQPAPPKPPETITGNGAFFKCYTAARGWAGDAQGFSAQSAPSKTSDGKSGEWRVGFASPAQRSTRLFTWSNGDISHSGDDTYSTSNSSTTVFNFQFLKIDTDKALSIAQEHGGKKLLDSTPDMAVIYLLDWNRQSNSLLWHVIYGPDRDNAKLRVAVNATTGEFFKVEK